MDRRISLWKHPIVLGAVGLAVLWIYAVCSATVVIETYKVQPGDTLEGIAERYKLSVDTLRRKNGFVEGQMPKPGAILVVPVSSAKQTNRYVKNPGQAASASIRQQQTPPQVTGNTKERVAGKLQVSEVYYVREGDTLKSIAEKYNVPAETIVAKNRLPSDGLLQPGQALAIPISESVVYHTETDNQSPGYVLANTPKCQQDSSNNFASESRERVVGRLGVITTGGARIRRSPRPSGRTVFVCTKGTQLVIVDHREDWYGVMMIDGSTCWVPKKYVQALDVELTAGKRDAGSPNGGAGEIINEAYRYLGIPYMYGGSSPRGIDCSAFVRRVFASRGAYLPRTAAAQFRVGSPVGYNQLLPGDRLYFSRKGRHIDHTGIYIGNGQMIHASGRAGCVTVDNLFNSKYWFMLVGIRR